MKSHEHNNGTLPNPSGSCSASSLRWGRAVPDLEVIMAEKLWDCAEWLDRRCFWPFLVCAVGYFGVRSM